MDRGKYYENRLIHIAAIGSLDDFRKLSNEYDRHISPKTLDLLIYYSSRNGYTYFCEYIISNYIKEDNYFTKNNKLFRYRDSCKKIYKFINNIDQEKTPNLYKYKTRIIKEYLGLAVRKAYVNNFSYAILQIQDIEERKEIFEEYFYHFKEQKSLNQRKFYNELRIVTRDNILESLLN